MKFKDINEKDDTGLKELLAERSKHLFDLRNQSVTSKLEDPSQLGKTKKDVARIKTVIRRRQLDAKKA